MSGSTMLWIVVAVLAAVVLVALVWWLVARRPKGRLRDTGERALARVTKVEATGAPVSEGVVRCAIAFQLEPLAGGRAFDRHATLTLAQPRVPRVGDVWPAWYRGTDPSAFEVEVPDPASPQQAGIFREFGLRHPSEPRAVPTGSPGGETAARHGTVTDLTAGTTRAPEASARAGQPPSQAVPQSDPVIELERLIRLRDNGSITDEEFAAAKAKYLRS